jgi:hypothetical protein
MGAMKSKPEVPGANGNEPVSAIATAVPTVNAPANNGNSNKYRAINNANQAAKNAQRNSNIIPVNNNNRRNSNRTNVVKVDNTNNNTNNNNNIPSANSGTSVTGSAEGAPPKSFNLSSMGSGTALTRRRSLKNRKQRGGAKAKTPKAKKTKGKKTMRK